MTLKDLNLSPGNWLVANCGNYPSEKHCQLVLLAPESQKNDLLEAALSHAVSCHEHQKSAEMRTSIEKLIEKISI